MHGDQILLFFAIVAFLAGASAILRVRTMQNTIDQQSILIDTLEGRVDAEVADHATTKSKNKELNGRLEQQQQQIDVLTNTVNSSDLIQSLDSHLTAHHVEAMTKFDRMHDDMVKLRDAVTR